MAEGVLRYGVVPSGACRPGEGVDRGGGVLLG